MNLDNSYRPLHDYLAQMPSATLEFPFGEDIYVYKIETKIFAILMHNNTIARLNVKCDPNRAQQLREIFPEITAGYHMSKKHWNTIDLRGQLPFSEITNHIDHSYNIIVKKLPRGTKQRLRILHEQLAWL
jgi:predicted DNA-binding protein (MmcQ/YjbR family)